MKFLNRKTDYFMVNYTPRCLIVTVPYSDKFAFLRKIWSRGVPNSDTKVSIFEKKRNGLFEFLLPFSITWSVKLRFSSRKKTNFSLTLLIFHSCCVKWEKKLTLNKKTTVFSRFHVFFLGVSNSDKFDLSPKIWSRGVSNSDTIYSDFAKYFVTLRHRGVYNIKTCA